MTVRRPTLQRLRRVRWDGVLSVALILLIAGGAVLAPVIAPMPPEAASLRNRFAPPSLGAGPYILGADHLGRDLLSRVLYGGRTSLLVGVTAVGLACTFGVAVGMLAGYYRGRFEAAVMALVEVQLAVPFLVLAIAVAAVLPPNPVAVLVILAISGWVIYARSTHAAVIAYRQQEFVLAARATGSRDLGIVLRHILPNLVPTIVVLASLQVPRMIMFEAALSYLGLGVPPPTPTWGGMVAAGQPYLSSAWWASIVPGAAIFLTVFAINLFGDWLQDRLDPFRR